MLKSDGMLLPPETFVVTLSAPNNPGGGTGRGNGMGNVSFRVFAAYV